MIKVKVMEINVKIVRIRGEKMARRTHARTQAHTRRFSPPFPLVIPLMLTHLREFLNNSELLKSTDAGGKFFMREEREIFCPF